MNNKSQKLIVFSGITFVIILALNIFWISFIRSEANNVLEFKKEVEIESTKNYSISNLKKQIIDLNEKNEKIDSVFIERNNGVGFIETIENISKVSGTELQIQNVDIEVVQKRDSDDKVIADLHGVLKMLFKVNGSWQEVTKFLLILETIPNHVTIDSVNFSTVNGGEGISWAVNFAISGITN